MRSRRGWGLGRGIGVLEGSQGSKTGVRVLGGQGCQRAVGGSQRGGGSEGSLGQGSQSIGGMAFGHLGMSKYTGGI